MSKVIVTTPIGKSEWFSLDKEDKFGNYTCNLKLEDSPETHKLISKIDDLNNGGKLPYIKEQDGSFTLKMKVKSRGTRKDGTPYVINPPFIYNAVGKKLEGQELAELNVGNGSEIRAKLELNPYEFMGQKGVSAKPKSVQIVKAVKFEGGDDFGFDALEFAKEDLGEQITDDSDF